MVVSFVVLHYMALQDTIECVDSIYNNIEYETVNIIIVDNGSTNDSYKELSEYYENYENVFVIHSDKNWGFAKGNNLGYQFAKQKLNSNFIILINNDTIIEQKDFCNLIIDKYKKEKFSVLGPDVINKNGEHQNPFFTKIHSLKELKILRMKNCIKILLFSLHLERIFLKKSSSNILGYDWNKEYKNIALHGSCLIFSPDYIQKFDGLNADTFMYFEEDILYLYSQHYKFLMMYSPDLKILHKEDVSTDILFQKREKEIFKYKQINASSKVYSKLQSEWKCVQQKK